MLVAGGGERAGAAGLLRAGAGDRSIGRRAGAARLGGRAAAVDVSFGDAAQVFHIGPASCGMYGAPAGVCEAVRRWGTCRSRSSPRRRRARARGCGAERRPGLRRGDPRDLLTSTPECAALWAPRARVLREGELLRNPELGDALLRLGAEGAEPFYRGDIAAAVCDWVWPGGGSLSAARPRRLRRGRARARRVGYRDREVLTNPPPSAGGTLLAYALALLDRGPAAADAERLSWRRWRPPSPSARRSSWRG
jgi:gamma-glutamyltranspeptidase/glutathione hydrolase